MEEKERGEQENKTKEEIDNIDTQRERERAQT